MNILYMLFVYFKGKTETYKPTKNNSKVCELSKPQNQKLIAVAVYSLVSFISLIVFFSITTNDNHHHHVSSGQKAHSGLLFGYFHVLPRITVHF